MPISSVDDGRAPLFFADCNGQRSIQLQSRDGCPSSGGNRHHKATVPLKVIKPRIRSRIKERHMLSGLRINCSLIGPLSQRAGPASQRQIVERRSSACQSRFDMVDVKRRFLADL